MICWSAENPWATMTTGGRSPTGGASGKSPSSSSPGTYSVAGVPLDRLANVWGGPPRSCAPRLAKQDRPENRGDDEDHGERSDPRTTGGRVRGAAATGAGSSSITGGGGGVVTVPVRFAAVVFLAAGAFFAARLGASVAMTAFLRFGAAGKGDIFVMPVVSRVLPPRPFENLEDYKATGGGKGLDAARKVETTDVIGEVEASGLRGRGGAGFHWPKWRTVWPTSGRRPRRRSSSTRPRASRARSRTARSCGPTRTRCSKAP